MTPALTLWRALNAEPPRCDANGRVPTRESVDWQNSLHRFAHSHPADQISYFEGLVREAGWQFFTMVWMPDTQWRCRWYSAEHGVVVAIKQPTEHTARLIAAARALAALGRITPEQLKEVEDGHH